MDIKDRIKKLLSLGTSPNENEAKAALLKAREMMARHKLTEEDFEEPENLELVHLKCNDIKWTTDSGNVWMVEIVKILCDNYMCAHGWATPRGTRTHTLVISGLEDDAELCKTVVEYAIGFVFNAINILQHKYPRQNPKTVARSYADGFAMGLEMAFEDQTEEHQEWGLVLMKPDKVQEFEKKQGTKSVTTKTAGFDPLAFAKGQNDGSNFNAKRVLEPGKEEG